jgi:protein-L-isoaspartate(D-aspartate) O-methyltransferase
MNLEQARFNMVEQQIRTWEVLDPSVLELLFAVKREDFVPPAYRALAFVDMEIPIGHGQSMMAPKMEARIVQELALKPTDRVLEIGTGSGYLTALLAHRAESVTSIEIFEDLSRPAADTLARAGIRNVHLKVGDAARSPDGQVGAHEKFDVIVLTGSTPTLPQAYLDRLTEGGRLFAVTGDAPVMEAAILTRTADQAFARRDIFETVLAPLVNAVQPSRFEF